MAAVGCIRHESLELFLVGASFCLHGKIPEPARPLADLVLDFTDAIVLRLLILIEHNILRASHASLVPPHTAKILIPQHLDGSREIPHVPTGHDPGKYRQPEGPEHNESDHHDSDIRTAPPVRAVSMR